MFSGLPPKPSEKDKREYGHRCDQQDGEHDGPNQRRKRSRLFVMVCHRLLPPPAYGERRHRGLARRLVAVRRQWAEVLKEFSPSLVRIVIIYNPATAPFFPLSQSCSRWRRTRGHFSAHTREIFFATNRLTVSLPRAK
jgi:hypothetical protein